MRSASSRVLPPRLPPPRVMVPCPRRAFWPHFAPRHAEQNMAKSIILFFCTLASRCRALEEHFGPFSLLATRSGTWRRAFSYSFALSRHGAVPSKSISARFCSSPRRAEHGEEHYPIYLLFGVHGWLRASVPRITRRGTYERRCGEQPGMALHSALVASPEAVQKPAGEMFRTENSPESVRKPTLVIAIGVNRCCNQVALSTNYLCNVKR